MESKLWTRSMNLIRAGRRVCMVARPCYAHLLLYVAALFLFRSAFSLAFLHIWSDFTFCIKTSITIPWRSAANVIVPVSRSASSGAFASLRRHSCPMSKSTQLVKGILSGCRLLHSWICIRCTELLNSERKCGATAIFGLAYENMQTAN